MENPVKVSPKNRSSNLPKRLVLYAHYNPKDKVAPYVYHSLGKLAEISSSLLFLSTSKINKKDTLKLQTQCEKIILCKNKGYDFAMWQKAISETDLGEYEELVLTNSSVIGPIVPLEPIFQKMSKPKIDFWGLTESAQHVYHLQSYFIVFKKTAIVSESFSRFWSSILPYKNVQQTIFSYELGLTTFLHEGGLRSSAAFKLSDIKKTLEERDALFFRTLWEKKIKVDSVMLSNVSIEQPLPLFDMGFPYIKVKLFVHKPVHHQMHELLSRIEKTGFDMKLLKYANFK